MWLPVVLGVLLGLEMVASENTGEWKYCPDKVQKKCAPLLGQLSEPLTIKDVNPCYRLEIYGLTKLKAGKGCAGREDENSIEQKFQFDLSNLTCICYVTGLSALSQMINYTAPLSDWWLGNGSIHAEWKNCQMMADLTVDLKEEKVIFHGGTMKSDWNSLRIWCEGTTSFMTIFSVITKLPAFPVLIGLIVKTLFGSKLPGYLEPQKDMLSEMGCDDGK